MCGVGTPARSVGDRNRRRLIEVVRQLDIGQVEQPVQLGAFARDHAAAEHVLTAGKMADAGGDLTGGEGLDYGKRRLPAQSLLAGRPIPVGSKLGA